jgi:hypothetical protein
LNQAQTAQQGGAGQGGPGEGGRDNQAGLAQGQSATQFASDFVNRNLAVDPDEMQSLQLASNVLNPGLGTIGYIANQFAGDPLGEGGINDAVRFTPEQQAAIEAQIAQRVAANPQAANAIAAQVIAEARAAYATNQQNFGWGSNPTQGAGLTAGGATTPSTPGMAVPAGAFPGVAQPVDLTGLQTLAPTTAFAAPAPSVGAPVKATPVSAAQATAARAAFAGSIPQGPERQAIMAEYDRAISKALAGSQSGTLTQEAIDKAKAAAKATGATKGAGGGNTTGSGATSGKAAGQSAKAGGSGGGRRDDSGGSAKKEGGSSSAGAGPKGTGSKR